MGGASCGFGLRLGTGEAGGESAAGVERGGSMGRLMGEVAWRWMADCCGLIERGWMGGEETEAGWMRRRGDSFSFESDCTWRAGLGGGPWEVSAGSGGTGGGLDPEEGGAPRRAVGGSGLAMLRLRAEPGPDRGLEAAGAVEEEEEEDGGGGSLLGMGGAGREDNGADEE